MPRLDPPSVAAILGVGLVLVIARSPGAEVRPAEAAAARVGAAIGRVGHASAPRSAVRAVPSPPEAPSEDDPDLVVVEEPDALARFAIPRDRLGVFLGRETPAPPRLSLDGAPLCVALVASWCGPCARELPSLLALAEEHALRLVLVSLDEIAGPESLLAVTEDLFDRAEPTSRTLPPLELRADPDGAWTDATAPVLAKRGDPRALPQTLLLSGDGELLMLVQGGFSAALAERALRHLGGAL